MKTLIFATATALLGIGSLCADVIVYNNGAPDHAFHSGSEMTHFIQSEDFVLAADTIIHDVHFWALDPTATVYQGSIAWAIALDDGSGVPGAVSASGSAAAATVTPTGFAAGGRSEKLIGFIIPDFSALAGQVYWLELHNGPTTTTGDLGFLWETTAGGAGSTGQEKVLPGGSTWEDNGLEHAFQLTAAGTSSVPEPVSAVLLVTMVGLVGLTSRRRRRCS